jgi:tRNA(Arg) A34 adenosine deaminase TadA
MTHEDYMKMAIEESNLAVKDGNAPFAVVVVNENGDVVMKDHDRVKEFMDPTAHGEINAIRTLCKQLDTLSLKNMTFYTTSEPCPTCLSACIKAKVKAIYYGAETELSASLPIKAKNLIEKSNYPIEIVSGILAQECLEQRDKWRNV